MEGSLSEVGQCVDVDPGVVDEPTDDCDAGAHGGVVERSPPRLISIVDVDRSYGVLFLEHLEKLHLLVLDDGGQECLVQAIEVLPIVLP